MRCLCLSGYTTDDLIAAWRDWPYIIYLIVAAVIVVTVVATTVATATTRSDFMVIAERYHWSVASSG